MSFLNDIRAYWYNYFLQKALQQKSFKRKPIDYKDAETIAILLNADKPSDLASIQSFVKKLEKTGKTIHVLSYSDQKLPPKDFPFDLFSKKEIDLLCRPKPIISTSFLDTPYDILINFSFDNCMPLTYLAALSKAHLRIGGVSENLSYYDLMIDEQKGIDAFIKQLEYFLNKMKNERYETAAV